MYMSKAKRFPMIVTAVVLALAMMIGFLPVTSYAGTVYVDRKADVVFAVDATGSMGPYISGVKSNLTSFINSLSAEGVDVRVRFIVYRDITCGEPTETSEWYTDPAKAVTYLNNIEATGGGDAPETLIDGLAQMFPSFGFRSGAAKFCIALTDADYKLDNLRGVASESVIIEQLEANDINTSFITNPGLFTMYRKFVSKGHSVSGEDGGVLANISGDYSIILKNFTDIILESGKTAVVKRMTPNYGDVGTATKVTVTADNLEYGGGFSVTLGGKPVEVTSQNSSSFVFLTPTNLPVGRYEVIITNAGGNISSAGYFTYYEKADETAPKLTAATPYSFVEKTDVTVTITGKNFSSPTVYIGDEEVTVTSASSTKLVVSTGTELAAGKYDLRIVNGDGKSVTAPDYFNVTLAPLPVPPEIKAVTPAKIKPDTDTKITITGTKFSEPIVKLVSSSGRTIELKVTASTASKIEAMSGELDPGSYDVQVQCGAVTTRTYTKPITVTERPRTIPDMGIKAVAGNATITVTWEPVAGATGYKVYSFVDGKQEHVSGTLSKLTFTRNFLKNGTTYSFAVLPTGGDVQYIAPTKGVVSATPGKETSGKALSAPTGVKAEAGNSTVTVTWNAVTGATGYKVYTFVDGKLEHTSGTLKTLTFTRNFLKNGTTYSFAVQAIGETSGAVPTSGVVSATPGNGTTGTPLSAPTDVKAEAGNSTVTVTWNAVTGATGYKVYTFVDGKLEHTSGTLKTLTFTRNFLTNGTTYSFAVQAIGETSGAVPTSGVVSATPGKETSGTPLSAPTDVKAEAGNSTVTVTWNAVDGATGYKVYSFVDGKLEHTSGTLKTLTFTRNFLTNGTTYSFAVQAIGETSGAIPTSGVVSATPGADTGSSGAALSTPTDVKAEAGNSTVTVTWNAVDGATGYKVYSFVDGKLEHTSGTLKTLTFTRNFLTNGKTYSFAVQAIGATSSDVPTTGVVSATPAAATGSTSTELPAPTNVKATAGNSTITVTWNAVDGATGYKVYSFVNGKLEHTSGTLKTLTFTRNFLKNGTTYSFAVQAIGTNSGEVPTTGVVSATPSK